MTAGVETTTGPLGQGFANGVGMAMAEKFLREKFGADACDHHIFGICSDGDLMEGVASEAASIAGHLRLGKLVYLYDDNEITIDGPTSLAFSTEDVQKRFEAYGWHTLLVEDGNDLRRDRGGAARRDGGGGAPDADQPAHGDRLRLAARRHPQRALRPDARRPGARDEGGARLGSRRAFYVPQEVVRALARAGARARRAAQAEWQERFHTWEGANAELAAEWHDAWAGRPRQGFREALPEFPADGRRSRPARRRATSCRPSARSCRR